MKRVSVPLSDEEIEAIDAARGEYSRAVYLHWIITQALVGEVVVIQRDIEDWRSKRGL